MIAELDADRADMAIGALSINPERERFIDFSEPWMYDKNKYSFPIL